MGMLNNPGQRFRDALSKEQPLQIVGTINALCAMQAARAGFHALYLSGAGVANASHGLPDLGVTNLNDVVADAQRIITSCSLPLLVDIDTGWGSELTIERAVRELEQVGAAAVHIEDQVNAKRCGHRPDKQLVDIAEMQSRLQAAVGGKRDGIVIMARTDAISVEGIDATINRAHRYLEAGAEMIFAEAVESLDDFRRLTRAIDVPILANLTEFGRTPSFTMEQLRSVGVRMALYPLTAFRAMNAAAHHAYATVREHGTQQSILHNLQTREELYDLLDYHTAERRQDRARKLS